ncbi:MAG: DNA repair protein RecO [Prevotella sp.]|nr:DNA repair protein RecO [Prevotella sp.]
MLTKTKAIVLRNLKYGEQKMIIDLLTESDGRVSVVIHIPKTQKGKLKKQYFQPLNILEVELDIRPKAQLQHLRDAHIAFPFTSIPFDPYKLSIALFLAEFIHYSTRDEQQNPTLFAYIEHSIQWLDGCMESFANFHLVFMMRLSRFIGFFPFIEDYSPGAYFDMRAASFTMQAPLHPDFLNQEDSGKIGTLMRMNYESMHLFKMSHDDRNRIIDVLITYYRLHVPNFPELKSLGVMKETWKGE